MRRFFQWLFRSRYYDEYEDVRQFHEKFRLLTHDRPTHLTNRKLTERVEFLQEELNEFKLAAAKQNLADQADALIDLVYVAKGTAHMLGLPWEALWREVQRANMDKVCGVTHRGHAVDVKKPLGWRPPDNDVVLACHGYRIAQQHRPWDFVDDPIFAQTAEKVS